MKPQIYSTSSFRLACSLITNGYPLEGTVQASPLSKRRYVFISSEELKQTAKAIEQGEDMVSSLGLYNAIDFLTKRIVSDSYQEDLKQEILFRESRDGD